MTQANIGISGGVIFWTLGGATDYDLLLSGFKAAGFEKHAPDRISTPEASKAALQDLFGGQRVLVRPLPNQAGYAVVDEKAGMTSALDHNVRITVRFPRLGQVSALSIRIDQFDGADDSDRIRRATQDQLDILPPGKVTGGMVAVIRALGGVPLRATGGIYWLPPKALSAWGEIVKAVEASGAGNQVYCARTTMDSEAVRAVVAAIREDVGQEVSDIRKEVEEGHKTSERALKSRALRTERLLGRVEDYEAALGVALTELRDGIQTCQQVIVTTAGMEMAAELRDIGAMMGGSFAGMGDTLDMGSDAPDTSEGTDTLDIDSTPDSEE